MKINYGIIISFISVVTAFGQGIISFESIPYGIPSDGMIVSNQFLESHGVTFSLADGSYPRLAMKGAPATAFLTGPNAQTALPDEIDPGQGMGTFFLTDDGDFSSEIQDLIIRYSTPVSSASGYLLDVDSEPTNPSLTEEWDIIASDAQSNVVATTTISSTETNTGDGVATFWSLESASSNITTISFVFTGTKVPQNVGIAFDNFSPAKSEPIDFRLEFLRALLIEWPSVEGLEYQVQWSDRLGGEANGWNNLGEPIIGNGATNSFYKAIRGQENSYFYRVIISN